MEMPAAQNQRGNKHKEQRVQVKGGRELTVEQVVKAA